MAVSCSVFFSSAQANSSETEELSPSRSLRNLVALAKAGNGNAQLELGIAYRDGKNVVRDKTLARHWLLSAAGRNIASAQFALAVMATENDNGKAPLTEAIEWYRKAALQGHTGASFALAEFYRTGQVVPQDFAQAARYYRVAAVNDDVKSQLALGKLRQAGMGIPKNQAEATGWFRHAAQQGSAEGCYLLAMALMKEDITGLPHHPYSQTTLEAMSFLQLAANQNYAPAQFSLGMAYLNGFLKRLDPIKALSLLTLAADQNYAPALYSLGVIYRHGAVVIQDNTRAYMYFDLAAQAGEKHAETERDNLGRDIPPPPDADRKKTLIRLDRHKNRITMKCLNPPPGASSSVQAGCHHSVKGTVLWH